MEAPGSAGDRPHDESNRPDAQKEESGSGTATGSGTSLPTTRGDNSGGDAASSSAADAGDRNEQTHPKSVGPLPAFLDRTFAMVDEQTSDDIVGWMAAGDTFVIKRLDLFEEEVIPRFFNHRNLFSFVRQLNNHGEPTTTTATTNITETSGYCSNVI